MTPRTTGDTHSSENFGHTQGFSAAKLSRDVPEFRPSTPLSESLAESIVWIAKRALVLGSDADDLEDRIIAAVRGLPDYLARTGTVN